MMENPLTGIITFGIACSEKSGCRPLTAEQAQELWDMVEREDAAAKEAMPTEQSAIDMMTKAWRRLKDFGWKEPQYGPKGEMCDVIELGSTGIHEARYEGKWPEGSWWLYDGDVWPCRPALVRAKEQTNG